MLGGSFKNMIELCDSSLKTNDVFPDPVHPVTHIVEHGWKGYIFFC